MCRSIHCLAHGQVAEPDNTDVAKPIKPSDNAIAENIVDGLADGNAKMVCIIILHIVHWAMKIKCSCVMYQKSSLLE